MDEHARSPKLDGNWYPTGTQTTKRGSEISTKYLIYLVEPRGKSTTPEETVLHQIVRRPVIFLVYHSCVSLGNSRLGAAGGQPAGFITVFIEPLNGVCWVPQFVEPHLPDVNPWRWTYSPLGAPPY